MDLFRVDFDRIQEDLSTLCACLESLDSIEEHCPPDDMPEYMTRRLVGVGISREAYAALPADVREAYYETVDDIHRVMFEQAWQDFSVSIARLDALLNHGDTTLMDCDLQTRHVIQSFCESLNNCRIEKPEFVPGGPQAWKGRAHFQAFIMKTSWEGVMLMRLGDALRTESPASGEEQKPANFPIVYDHPTGREIEFKGTKYKDTGDCATAFQAMIEAYPERISLAEEIGVHPERKVRRWHADLQAIVDTNGKGSRLNL